MSDEVQLLVPERDAVDPELSIVVPALDEALTVGAFVAWCHEGLRAAGVVGEILIVDSSTDDTAAIAVAAGARVLRTPRRGLGRAYLDALPFVRGRFVVMGDADCTYDFRALPPFVEKLREGHEFVMGSRFAGSIEPGAMPPLHRYLGTPVTTWVLNRIYGSRFTDIHCGMRGLTRDAWVRMSLRSQSWEYASEMVLKSVRLGLRTAEVPVHFLKDREDRLSHHRRAGWTSPWLAAWINLRVMFVHGVDFFLLRPGLALLALGLSLTLPATFGPVSLGPIHVTLVWMLLGLTISTVGLQSFYAGCLAQVLNDESGAARRRWLSLFRYDRAALGSAFVFLSGVALTLPLLSDVVWPDPSSPRGSSSASTFQAVTGLFAVIAGFTTFCFTLLIHAVAGIVRRTDG